MRAEESLRTAGQQLFRPDRAEKACTAAGFRHALTCRAKSPAALLRTGFHHRFPELNFHIRPRCRADPDECKELYG
jgi:hypothetical protein